MTGKAPEPHALVFCSPQPLHHLRNHQGQVPLVAHSSRNVEPSSVRHVAKQQGDLETAAGGALALHRGRNMAPWPFHCTPPQAKQLLVLRCCGASCRSLPQHCNHSCPCLGPTLVPAVTKAERFVPPPTLSPVAGALPKSSPASPARFLLPPSLLPPLFAAWPLTPAMQCGGELALPCHPGQLILRCTSQHHCSGQPRVPPACGKPATVAAHHAHAAARAPAM